MIKQRLCHSNVLIVLDDVDHIDQLSALAGSRDWFGDGSRVIITTRDEHLLKTPVSLLSRDEAVKLFRKYAYRENEPIKDYEELSLRVVSYSDGLPLPLKVLGSFLYDKDSNEWLSALDKLKANPNMEIVQKLKISYDGLEPLYQELFLDIACFFRGRNVEKTKQILEACEFYPDIGIRVLIQKALITISKDDMGEDIFDMHDLIEEMGHYIIQGAHRDNPEEHSRLWQTQIIDDLRMRDEIKPNDKVKAIRYDGALSRFPELVSNMKKVRLLVMDNDRCPFLEGPSVVSNELRCLHWPCYPASLFPENFHPTKLAYLNLDCSLQKELWKDYKALPNLKRLQLCYLENLLKIPNIDGLPCLEELLVFLCVCLEEIHPSLGNHRSLVKVSVSSCKKLRMLPPINRMKKLKTLEISSCPKLLKFLEILTNEGLPHLKSIVLISLQGLLNTPDFDRIPCLEELIVFNCDSLEEIHPSLGDHRSLVKVSVSSCKKLRMFPSITRMEKLESFTFISFQKIQANMYILPVFSLIDVFPLSFGGHCTSLTSLRLGSNFKDGEIPCVIGKLSNLQVLDLSENDFSRLHFSLSRLTRLKVLILSDCYNLVELPRLPSNIAILIARNCSSLASIGDGLTDCKWLSQVFFQGSHVTDANKLLGLMLQGYAVENHSMIFQVEGTEI